MEKLDGTGTLLTDWTVYLVPRSNIMSSYRILVVSAEDWDSSLAEAEKMLPNWVAYSSMKTVEDEL